MNNHSNIHNIDNYLIFSKLGGVGVRYRGLGRFLTGVKIPLPGQLEPRPRKLDTIEFRKILLFINKILVIEIWENWIYMHICIFYWIGGNWWPDIVALEACTYDRKPDRLQIKRIVFHFYRLSYWIFTSISILTITYFYLNGEEKGCDTAKKRCSSQLLDRPPHSSPAPTPPHPPRREWWYRGLGSLPPPPPPHPPPPHLPKENLTELNSERFYSF